TGTKALERAPSAKRSRVRLGMRNPNMNASNTSPAPNKRAIRLSRTRPVIRLMNTASDTTPAERTTFSFCDKPLCVAAAFVGATSGAVLVSVILFAVLFEKVGNCHDACVVIRQLIFLVGGVQPVVGQSESHKYGGDAKVPREIAHNRNRSAAA